MWGYGFYFLEFIGKPLFVLITAILIVLFAGQNSVFFASLTFYWDLCVGFEPVSFFTKGFAEAG